MTDPNDALAHHLQSQAAGRPPGKQMTFDPATGELRLVPRKPQGVGVVSSTPVLDPDGIVVDQIAETGFFACDLVTHGPFATSPAAGEAPPAPVWRRSI